MVVKIISAGIANWQTVYEAKCRRCRCVFRCDKSDGQYQPDDWRHEGDFVRIKCPNCGDECFAYPKKIGD